MPEVGIDSINLSKSDSAFVVVLEDVDLGVLTFGALLPVRGLAVDVLAFGLGEGEVLTRGVAILVGKGFVVAVLFGPLPRRPSMTIRPSLT